LVIGIQVLTQLLSNGGVAAYAGGEMFWHQVKTVAVPWCWCRVAEGSNTLLNFHCLYAIYRLHVNMDKKQKDWGFM
jgi:hypothetical protein